MKGALLAAKDPGFFYEISRALSHIEDYCKLSDGQALVLDQKGRLFSLYPHEEDDGEFDNQLLDDLENSGVDLRGEGMSVLFLVECRWEELFCRLLRDCATRGISSFLIIDAKYQVWKPEDLREDTIML